MISKREGMFMVAGVVVGILVADPAKRFFASLMSRTASSPPSA